MSDEKKFDLKFDLATFWGMERNRPLQKVRPCKCGCDTRDGLHEGWAGYLSFANADGDGFSLWIRDEADYRECVGRL